MQFLKRRFAHAPEGTAALFFIQIFATLGFAVLYSTLVLYATKHLHLGVKHATMLMGVFGAFNYGLHLFGGYLGGRFLSNRNLFVGSWGLQVIAFACIRFGRLPPLSSASALFLPGRGLTLIYLTVSHRDRREQRNMTAYLILTVGSLMFWSLYQMAPSGLMLFAVNNVNLMVGPVKIQPQWIQNINTVCIVLGGPLLAALFTRTRARVDNRHPSAVFGVAAFDGGCVSHSIARHQAGRGGWQERVCMALHELRA